MGWKARPKPTFRTLGRIAASASYGDGSEIEPERMEVFVEGVLHRALEIGTVAPEDEANWRRHLHADLTGACLQLGEREEQLQQQIANTSQGNGNLAGRRPGDDEQVIAAAVREGRFRAERAEHWRVQFKRDPVGTRRLLTADPADGGLLPIAAGMPHAPRALGEAESAIGSVHPQAATRLGLRVERPHPLAEGLPGRVMAPPPPRRIHVVSDRA